MKDNTQAIQASKEFNKSVNELYDAWINPDKLKQWWHPAENKLVNVENEVQEGGHIKYEFETANSEQAFVITGEYKEVQPAAKLVYSWNWQLPGNNAIKDNHFELTVAFSGDDSSSTINITQHNLDDAESVHPHRKGWEDELESLHRFLA